MYNPDTELIFPPRVIPDLREQRDGKWRDLVDHVAAQPDKTPEQLAFVLMMARLNSCNTCNADSFRAMRGCTQCSQQNVRRYRGTESELEKEYKKALKDIASLTR